MLGQGDLGVSNVELPVLGFASFSCVCVYFLIMFLVVIIAISTLEELSS